MSALELILGFFDVFLLSLTHLDHHGIPRVSDALQGFQGQRYLEEPGRSVEKHSLEVVQGEFFCRQKGFSWLLFKHAF